MTPQLIPQLDQVSLQPQTLDNLDQHKKAARSALLSLKNNRVYALDSASETSLVAAFRVLWTAIQEALIDKITNADFLQRVIPFEKSLVQSWRPGPPEPPPKEWLDPVSGKPLPNPWLSGIDAHFKPQQPDLDSRSVLIALDPKLAAHFQRMAKDPYRYLAELKQAETKRAAYAAVIYNADVHKTSPYVVNGGNDAAIAAFIQTHDPLTIEVFREEAKAIRCFWSPFATTDGPHRTTQSVAIKTDPLVGHLLLAATKIEGQLIALQRAEAEAAKNAAAARAKSLMPAGVGPSL